MHLFTLDHFALKAFSIKLLRAFLLGTAIVVCVVIGCLSRADARVGESLITFGDSLAKWTGGKLNSKEGRLTLNGVAIHRVTLSTPHSVAETLDRLQSACAERGGAESPEALLKKLSDKPQSGKRSGAWDGTYRYEGRNQGVLACIETDKPLGYSELLRRLGDFGKTGDLASVGRLRYVLARRDSNVTSLLVLWTDGYAPILKMFPKTGDAPGSDVHGVPRPQHSRRWLSAIEQGSPYSITMYRSEGQPPAAVRDWYERELKTQGWLVARTDGKNALVLRRAGRTLFLSATAGKDGRVTTSIIELS